MAKAFGGKRPQNLRHTLRRFGDYLGHHKRKLALIGVLTSISALAALIGTYMIRPAVNGILENGSLAYLARVVAFTAFVYLIGALSPFLYIYMYYDKISPKKQRPLTEKVLLLPNLQRSGSQSRIEGMFSQRSGSLW